MGEDFLSSDGYTMIHRGRTNGSALDRRAIPPPCWPWPDLHHSDDAAGTAGEADETETEAAYRPRQIIHEATSSAHPAVDAAVPAADDESDAACASDFAELEGRVLERLREAVRGCDVFVERRCGEYIAFDYKSAGIVCNIQGYGIISPPVSYVTY